MYALRITLPTGESYSVNVASGRERSARRVPRKVARDYAVGASLFAESAVPKHRGPRGIVYGRDGSCYLRTPDFADSRERIAALFHK